MQGTVYGARMDEAQAYPGAMDFLRWAAGQGIGLYIVSHKTRYPFIGPMHDLHAAARRWAERYLAGMVDPESVFFELTKEEKIGRIRATGCQYYIDDLPEILLAPGFPGDVGRILFDPEAHHAPEASWIHLRSWGEILAFFERECSPKQ
jgi:hypothetical protein